jgi:predicted nuclease with TOPRIM domain
VHRIHEQQDKALSSENTVEKEPAKVHRAWGYKSQSQLEQECKELIQSRDALHTKLVETETENAELKRELKKLKANLERMAEERLELLNNYNEATNNLSELNHRVTVAEHNELKLYRLLDSRGGQGEKISASPHDSG